MAKSEAEAGLGKASERHRATPSVTPSVSARTAVWFRRIPRWALVIATQVALTAIVLVTWQALAGHGIIETRYYSSPSGIWDAFGRLLHSGELWENLWASLYATLVGFAIGSAIGIAAGLIIGTSDFLDQVFSPLIAILNAMPRIAFAPLLIVWFGLTMWAKVWMAVSLCVFILLLNTRSAARSVDRDFVTLSRISGLGWFSHFFQIVLPSALPAIFAGLRLSVVYAFLGVIASEMIVARDGLGTLILKYSNSVLDVDALFALLLVVALLATALTLVVQLAERRLLHWQSGASRGG